MHDDSVICLQTVKKKGTLVVCQLQFQLFHEGEKEFKTPIKKDWSKVLGNDAALV